ncbi:MAG: OmpA family protein [Saprospiraceae bacterium]
MMRYLLFLGLFLGIFITPAAAQPSSAAYRHYMDGEQLLLSRDYDKAARALRRALDADPKMAIASRLLGEAEYLQGHYTQAVSAFSYTLELDPNFSRVLYYKLGEVYYKMGRAELGLYYFKKFRDLNEVPLSQFTIRGEAERAEELLLRDRLPASIRACHISLDSSEFINVTTIENLGPNINSKDDDYFPFLANNGNSLYYTRLSENGDEDLWFGFRRSPGRWDAERVKGGFNTNQPEGMTTLVRDGRQIFFTVCGGGKDTVDCNLFSGIVDDNNRIRNKRPIGGFVNSREWDSQAAVSCDGRRLFFASNRPGGLGGSDIWYCERTATGDWSEPRNIGAPVNTAGDEESPFLSNDGQTLYFASTGHLGLGEQDLFMSWYDPALQRWTVAINLGPPVNSPHRELGLHLSADGRTGFFASDRPGGQGGMDIYEFTLSEKLYGEPTTYVQGYARDSVTRSPIPHAVIQIDGGQALRTDELGRFFICVGADVIVDLSAEVETYLPYHQNFAIPKWDNRKHYDIDLLLRPEISFIAELRTEPPADLAPTVRKIKVVRTHPVYFGFDGIEVNSDELIKLDEFLESLMGEEIERISVTGYADDIGGSEYNLRLSEQRARSVAVSLLQRRQSVDQIQVNGVGSISTDQPREQNRRVDIKITLIREN